MEKNQKNFDALQAEREELRLLIGNGISFTVNYQEAQVTKVPRWANWLGKIFKRKVTIKQDLQREYIIKEPTLFTLDRLSAEYIELKIDEQKIKEAQGSSQGSICVSTISVWLRLLPLRYLATTGRITSNWRALQRFYSSGSNPHSLMS